MKIYGYKSNGCICDVCGKYLIPDKAIKLRASVLDRKIDNTGRYKSISKTDLCMECYSKIMDRIKYKKI